MEIDNPIYYKHEISYEHFKTCSIKFNNIERIQHLPPNYYRVVHPYNNQLKVSNKKIYTYSFSLKPNEYQPNGTCNFSKIDKPQLNFEGTLKDDYEINVYAINYNILRIISGMGGLLYS